MKLKFWNLKLKPQIWKFKMKHQILAELLSIFKFKVLLLLHVFYIDIVSIS